MLQEEYEIPIHTRNKNKKTARGGQGEGSGHYMGVHTLSFFHKSDRLRYIYTLPKYARPGTEIGSVSNICCYLYTNFQTWLNDPVRVRP